MDWEGLATIRSATDCRRCHSYGCNISKWNGRPTNQQICFIVKQMIGMRSHNNCCRSISIQCNRQQAWCKETSLCQACLCHYCELCFCRDEQIGERKSPCVVGPLRFGLFVNNVFNRLALLNIWIPCSNTNSHWVTRYGVFFHCPTTSKFHWNEVHVMSNCGCIVCICNINFSSNFCPKTASQRTEKETCTCWHTVVRVGSWIGSVSLRICHSYN